MTSILISLTLGWILFFWVYRSYFGDRFREQVFLLRDELFDMAVDGDISFEDPAYRMFRKTLNGMAQVGSSLNLVNLLVFLWVVPKGMVKAVGCQNDWQEALQLLPEDTCRRLARMRDRLHYYVLEHVVATSVLLTLTLFAAVMWILVRTMRDKCFACVQTILRRPAWASLMLALDSSAMLKAR